MSKKVRRLRFGFAVLLLACPLDVIAGPPFLTDDPQPVDYQHWEAYLFATGDHARDGYAINGPAVEVNYGVLPETQLHLIVPMTTVGGSGAPTVSGLGDMEFGIKYRFVHETNDWPQIGTFPMIEIPTGDADRGLGNGRAWFRLPIWAQKSWGAVDNLRWRRRGFEFCSWSTQLSLRWLAVAARSWRAPHTGW
jgi:hypothetical protein